MCKFLADTPLSEAKKGKAVLVPVGSLEDHGPLPLGLDTKIAERVACSVKDCLVSPSINYSFSPEHPHSVSIPLSVISEYLVQLTRQLYELTSMPVIYVVAHKGAVPVVQAAVMESFKDGVRSAALDLWGVVESLGYKSFKEQCRAEASLALALGYSVVVRKSKHLRSPPELDGATIPWKSTEYGCSPEWVSGARKEEGEKLLEAMSHALEELVNML